MLQTARCVFAGVLTATLLWLVAAPAHASFHFAHIDEMMVSYGGDPDVQFVEIRMLTGGQQFVAGSELNAFDASGTLIGTILTVPSNVTGGGNRSWIMGTAAFETASGLTADFIFTPGLPVGGGMVCWGKPGVDSNVNCNSSTGNYIDCIAYGNYAGPSNTCIGNPTLLTGEGYGIKRIADTHDNLTDLVCNDPAEPENNDFEVEQLVATTPCPGCGDNNTDPGEDCDGTDDAACPGLCLPNCVCPVCGDDSVNQPSEECDGTDDGDCPGDCLGDCTALCAATTSPKRPPSSATGRTMRRARVNACRRSIRRSAGARRDRSTTSSATRPRGSRRSRRIWPTFGTAEHTRARASRPCALRPTRTTREPRTRIPI